MRQDQCPELQSALCRSADSAIVLAQQPSAIVLGLWPDIWAGAPAVHDAPRHLCKGSPQSVESQVIYAALGQHLSHAGPRVLHVAILPIAMEHKRPRRGRRCSRWGHIGAQVRCTRCPKRDSCCYISWHEHHGRPEAHLHHHLVGSHDLHCRDRLG